MLLVFDIGNTSTAIGAYESGALVARWHLHTDRRRSTDELAAIMLQLLAAQGLAVAAVDGAAVCCVVPAALDPVVSLCQTYFRCQPLVISAGSDLGLRILYDPPQSVGADRLVNAFAAAHKYGLPVIVVDLGTATKFEAVSADAEYLGGAIAPGVGVSLETLFERAAKLPRIELTAPSSVIAADTVSAIQAGIIYGTAGEVDAIIRRMKAEIGPPLPRVVATGGYAAILTGISTEVQIYDVQLTLDGLYLAHQQAGRAGHLR